MPNQEIFIKVDFDTTYRKVTTMNSKLDEYKGVAVRIEHIVSNNPQAGVNLIWHDLRIDGIQYDGAKALALEIIKLSYTDIAAAVRLMVSRSIYRLMNS